MLDQEKIARLIPHAGSMCLITRVTAWTATTIACESDTHRDRENPLRRDGILGAVCSVEYAAQAMAIHGRLDKPAGERPKMGFLASIREVKLHVARLDDLPAVLTIQAGQLLGEAGRVIYEFSLSSEGRIVVEGRAAVVLQPQ